MYYKVEIDPNWKYQTNKHHSDKEHQELGIQQMNIHGFWLMDMVKFIFPYGVIVGTLMYMQCNVEMDKGLYWGLIGIEACMIGYLLIKLLKSIRNRITFYEYGMEILSSKRKVKILYSEIVKIDISERMYRKGTSIQSWTNATIPITIISIHMKTGLSVTFTSEEFYNIVRKMKLFLESIG